ncbi:MAG: hypothetical protein AAGK66_09460 [Pseudomonadota bacterium]
MLIAPQAVRATASSRNPANAVAVRRVPASTAAAPQAAGAKAPKAPPSKDDPGIATYMQCRDFSF